MTINRVIGQDVIDNHEQGERYAGDSPLLRAIRLFLGVLLGRCLDGMDTLNPLAASGRLSFSPVVR
ncbi:hypothetical protein [Budvicia aquatica]|uniref:hypothetical protein n=1 Tax=Budvicia aquatica TaxID=82979 RepID=UPI000429EC29|nr:hypothetical protein [Budvicia aquatica]